MKRGHGKPWIRLAAAGAFALALEGCAGGPDWNGGKSVGTAAADLAAAAEAAAFLIHPTSLEDAAGVIAVFDRS